MLTLANVVDNSQTTPSQECPSGIKPNFLPKRKQLLEPWPGPWKLWAEKYCRANYWRVEWYLGDFEDCVQECAYIFVECQKRYGEKVESPAHFMALYKRMVQTWFTDYSNYDTKIRNTAEQEAAVPSMLPGADLDALLIHRTRKSSSEVKQVVRLLLGAPSEILDEVCREVISAKNYLEAVIRKTGISDQEKINRVQSELREALIGGPDGSNSKNRRRAVLRPRK